MKTKNNLFKGVLIGLGIFIVPFLLMSSDTQTNKYQTPQIIHGTPESHIYEVYGGEGNTGILLNKVTGDVWEINLNGSRLKKLVVR